MPKECNDGQHIGNLAHFAITLNIVVIVSPASMKVRPLLQPEGRKSMWQGAVPPETRETKESEVETSATV